MAMSIAPPVMTDDASTAYICIYCPFNSNNLEALENHLTRIHGHGCQDTSVSPSSPPQSSTLSNSINRTGKREAPDDEQSSSFINGIKQITESSPAVKRLKRTVSPTNVFINGNNDNSEDDDDDDDDIDEFDDHDERDSSGMSPETFLTCPICSSTYHRLGHLLRHAKRKHHMDLSNYDGPRTFDMLTAQINPIETTSMEMNKNSIEPLNIRKTEDINGSKKSTQLSNETNSLTSVSDPNTTTDCPYCDYKTTDIEQFKLHIVAHIRDKNYRCLLCNRLYKYRGDCSFHIRRKHHRYSANSNEYIQRFLFDTTDGDETMSTQPGGHGSLTNGSNNGLNMSREPDEPVRYFGCPYCDYTSNYGGDVRKHQARKHPNAESKVIKIIRQDSEQQSLPSLSSNQPRIPLDDDEDDDDDDERDSRAIVKSTMNSTGLQERKEKIKTVKKTDGSFLPSHPSPLAILPNFAPVRVFQCSSCHQQGTYKWVVERHIRAKHPEQPDVHVIELPAELAVKIQKITPPLKRYRCSLCPLQSKHTWVIIRHIKHFHTLQTASVLDIQPDGTPMNTDGFSMPNGDLPSNRSDNPDSDSSSISSSCIETGPDGVTDFSRQQDIDDEDDESDHNRPHINGNMTFIYKCSLCDFASNIAQDTQNHINDLHPGQSKAHMLTQCRSITNDNHQKMHNKKSKHKNGNTNTMATVMKTLTASAPLSPASALAKAKFSPAVEEALLSLQGSKINMGLFAVQPKFGIKRLKCRHCFYRSNWKTDMIRHVRIRHSLTDPDHNRDMIIMTEQEARSTIETYENTFGKELRRRTFRTWNDWAKAEEEFTPKDGSLQYTNPAAEAAAAAAAAHHGQKAKKATIATTPTATTSGAILSMINDEVKRIEKTKPKQESKTIGQNYNQSVSNRTEEFKQLPNPSNIVSRLLWTNSPSRTNDDDAPLDLSLKPTFTTKTNSSSKPSTSKIIEQNGIRDRESEDDCSTVNYICSVCPYKRSNLSAVQQHLSLHLTGSGIVCPLCSYTTSSNSSMIRHMTTVHPTSQSITQFASAIRVANATIIEQHQCPQCSYQCEHAEALDVHRRLEHEDDEEYDIDSSSSIVEDDERDLTIDRTNDLFQCPSCSPSSTNNNYSNLEQFTIHVYTNHHNHLHNNQSCPFCSYLVHTTSTRTLLEHIKLHFNGTLVQPDPIIGTESVKELLME